MWEVVLSSEATRALGNWMDERDALKKYDDSDAIWLTKYGNPYSSGSLNSLLKNSLSGQTLSHGIVILLGTQFAGALLLCGPTKRESTTQRSNFATSKSKQQSGTSTLVQKSERN
jgi:hypothetical protein